MGEIMQSGEKISQNKEGDTSGENPSFREKFGSIFSEKEKEEEVNMESEKEEKVEEPEELELEEPEESEEVELEEPEVEEEELEKHVAVGTSKIEWVQDLESEVINRNIEREAERFCQRFELDREDLDAEEITDRPYIRFEQTIPVLRGTREVKIVNRPYTGETVEDGDFDAEEHDIADTLSEIFDGEKKVLKKDGVVSLIVDVDGDTFVVSVSEL